MKYRDIKLFLKVLLNNNDNNKQKNRVKQEGIRSQVIDFVNEISGNQ